MFIAADMTRNDKISVLLQKRQEHDIHELNKAVNEFRVLHQQADSRREFDLNDPDALKKDKPARVSDDDPRCGVSSLQKFVGEDLNGKARQKLQQEQARYVNDGLFSDCKLGQAHTVYAFQCCASDNICLKA